MTIHHDVFGNSVFLLLFSIFLELIYFESFSVLVRITKTMWKKSFDCRDPCVIPNFKRIFPTFPYWLMLCSKIFAGNPYHDKEILFVF